MNTSPEREAAIFNAARRLPPGERAFYLEGACAANADLRQRVEELLRAHEVAGGGFLQELATGTQGRADAAVAPNPVSTIQVEPNPSEQPGVTIDRYKLLEKIGEGGFGVVYVAEQKEPVKRRVALKIIKPGMDTKQVVARFGAERQALALMDHPNIAKVLDAGTTAGRPYFVMELVRGIKLTDYCDQHKLSTKERLDLFIQVCRAIQHAHQKGVIHRDIKPSNILVTLHDGVPVPKVIDFGIAKATQGELTDQTVYTQFQQFIGTPAYMSPEQAEMSGLDIDTRSDIYALGVLLYELLTGKTPFDPKELMAAGLDQMRRTIREKEPVRPSTRLSAMVGADLTDVAKQRQTDAPKLVHLIRGDLDWIVMRALEKDRTRRYETANGLMMDLQRYLSNEPVFARPPSAVYRLGKMVRRNKLAFAAAGAVGAALIVGLGVSTLMFLKERASRKEAEASGKAARMEAEKNRQAYELFGKVFGTIFRSASGDLRKEIVALADDASENLDAVKLQSQPEVGAHVRSLLGTAYGALHEPEKSEAMFRSVLDFNGKIRDDANLDVAAAFHGLGMLLLNHGDFVGAEAMYREALRIEKRFSDGVNPQVLDCLTQLGVTLARRGNTAAALTLWNDALVLENKLWPVLKTAPSMESNPSVLLAATLRAEGEPGKVLRLYSKWADAGNAEAQHSLGEMYLHGEGVGKDLEEANRWFHKAEKVYRDQAQRGDARAAFCLSRMYQLGEGVTRNTSEAVKWLREAEENGKLYTLNDIAWVLATCKDPATRDGAVAVDFAERAAAASGRKEPDVLDTLACAYAETGQFAKAVDVQKEAIALLHSDRMRTNFTSHLQLFEAKLPYHEHD